MMQREIESSEYWIPAAGKNDVILRIDSNKNNHLIVWSVVFIKVHFLENVEELNPGLNYEDIKNLFS